MSATREAVPLPVRSLAPLGPRPLRGCPPVRRVAWRACIAAAAIALGAAAARAQPAQPTEPAQELVYDVMYEARILPTERAAHVTIRVKDPQGYLRQIDMRIDPERQRDFRGTGDVEVSGDRVRWRPEPGISRLEYVFRIDHLRDERSYDARCAESWAIFRGDDLVPPAAVTALTAARSSSRLRLEVPEGWSAVASYRAADDGTFLIDDPDRRFDRPTGWMTVGKLGVMRETVAGTRVAVASPSGQHVHRLDILALLRWTLPALREQIGELPDRLLIVGAGDPMWRGALSGPRSAYVHAARPLISNDGTSPVLHEVVHSTLGIKAGKGGDWIVEGLAELYSMDALVRSETISRKRYKKALNRMRERGSAVASLEVDSSSGAVTARAVSVLAALGKEIGTRTEGRSSLDDVVRILIAEPSNVTTASLEAATQRATGLDFSDFFRRQVGATKPK